MHYKKKCFYGLAFAFGAFFAFILGIYLKNYKINRLISFSTFEETETALKDDYGSKHQEDSVKLSDEQISQIGLKIGTAGSGDLYLSLSARGKIIMHPDHLAHIIPKISGIVKEANKNIGDFVNTGEVMAVLESSDMADIKASYLAALSKKKFAMTSLEREKRLYEEKVSAGQDYLVAKNSDEEAMINLLLATQKLRAFGLNDEEIDQLADQKDSDLRNYQIHSPIDGTVIMRHITKGEFIDNKTTIYEVADLKTVWVEIGIYPKDLYRVKVGQIVEVLVPVEDKKAEARLIYVSPLIAEETITAKAVAEIDNSEGTWRPGVFVKVNISTEKTSFPIVISKEAVQVSEGREYVFVATPEGFKRRFIKTGKSDNQNVEVISGLNSQERYAVNNTFLLKAELNKGMAEHED